MKKIIPILSVTFLVLFSSCNAVSYEKDSVDKTNIGFFDKTLVIKTSVDLDAEVSYYTDYINDAEKIEIYVSDSAETIKFPDFPNVKNLNVEINGALKVLDIGGLKNLKEFTLLGKVEEIILPKNLESISTYGQTDLSLFSMCENIRSVQILGVAGLKPLQEFSSLESVFIMSKGNDLSLLNELSFSTLRLLGVTDKELNALDGCPIDTLQINDETISDLSVIKRLPNLSTVFLTVSGDKNQWVTTFTEPTEDELDKLKTPTDISILKEFLKNGGTLYLVDDPNR